MKTSELEGGALDYWCARALVDENEEIFFIRVEPNVVVTFTHGTLRKLAQPFAPAEEWADAVEILERARELKWIRGGHGTYCQARFDAGSGGALEGEAQAAHPRVALLRAFVRARFGDTVEACPTEPHAVRGGIARPYDAGGVPPTYGDNAGAENEIGNIRSVPRP